MQINYAIIPAVISIIKVRDGEGQQVSKPIPQTAPRSTSEEGNLPSALGARRSKGSAVDHEGTGDKRGWHTNHHTSAKARRGAESHSSAASAQHQPPDPPLCVGPRPLPQTFIISSCSGLETRVSPSTFHRVYPEDLTELPGDMRVPRGPQAEDSRTGSLQEEPMSQSSSLKDEHPLDPSPPFPQEAPTPALGDRTFSHARTWTLPSSVPRLGAHCLLPSCPATSSPSHWLTHPANVQSPSPDACCLPSSAAPRNPVILLVSSVCPRGPGPSPWPSPLAQPRWRCGGQEGGLPAWPQLLLLGDRLCSRCVISCGNANLNFLRCSS